MTPADLAVSANRVRRSLDVIRRADWAGCGVSVVEGEAAGEGEREYDAVILEDGCDGA